MLDIWSFLLQTLTASGAALLILTVKALFRDKLPPKWQFAVWSVLGLLILLPAGLWGRYVLFRWQMLIEILKSFAGDYGFTRVLFPVPAVLEIPRSVPEWIFALYTVGVLVYACKYVLAYFRLKRILRFGTAPCDEKTERIHAIATAQGIRIHRIIEIEALPSAFVFGVFRPILVLPAGNDIDGKIILHELFHLRGRDTLWSAVICAMKTLHWCNPLLVYCAHRALSDMESRCDQSVLECLESEERREYGRILLSMANERFSKTPGSTCINNGGKNIRTRIENIARFKKYPQGMRPVSVCLIIVLAFPLTVGTQTSAVYEWNDSVALTLASARSTPCTTPAGAFDAYGKAILHRNGYYRAMCAPEHMQEDILTEMLEKDRKEYPIWDPGLDEWANRQKGYYIYNLMQIDRSAYEGLFVVELNDPPNGEAEELNTAYLAVQKLRVEKENGRWVAIPIEDFRHVETPDQNLRFGCIDLPGIAYTGSAGDFQISVTYQTIHTVESTAENGGLGASSSSRDGKAPKPNTEFTFAARGRSARALWLGNEADKSAISSIGLSFAPVYAGEKRPSRLRVPPIGEGSGGSNIGEQWITRTLLPGWASALSMEGGGGSTDPTEEVRHPQYYAADLYVNGEKAASLDLTLQKGADQ